MYFSSLNLLKVVGFVTYLATGVRSTEDADLAINLRHKEEYNKSLSNLNGGNEKSYDDWTKGIDFERNFWDGWMKSKGSLWPADFNDRVQAVRPIQAKFINALSNASAALQHLRILDCGAGPLTMVGNSHEKYSIELFPVDPLSRIYDELLAKYDIVPHPRTQHMMVERVADVFPLNYFDVAHIQNALDHSGEMVWLKCYGLSLLRI